MRNWRRGTVTVGIVLAVLLVVGVVNAGIYDNPDSTDPMSSSERTVILDDGTPFLRGAKLAPAPPTIGSPQNDRLFCANHTANLAACYACAERSFVYGHGNPVFYAMALDACNLVDEFR